MAFRVEGVKSERRFAGARNPSEADQRVFRQLETNVLLVVDAGAFDLYGRSSHGEKGFLKSENTGVFRLNSFKKLLYSCLEIKVFSHQIGNRRKDA